ncbi:MAG: SMP-30/gluconolactonase/LRE family protein [Sphingomonas sp.]|uniref:SMP-30/gluconolactonase/LRE family protein n=1 Tax=Sphingomonas sp. TaxID=28214 RepID=UPI0025FB0C0A|nr:SMP-30/gluconolactonase/LRE family protein [Sphingomonas sp.]MBX3563684.1 SMP-30/gluconolactonase/LRE family protein [Sphingomonas sp.]
MIRTTRRTVLAGIAATPFLPGLARAEAVGRITRFDDALDAVIDVASPIEVLGTGYKWAEGPVWVKKGGYLLFNDVPSNVCYQWRKGKIAKFLDPSGLTGPIPAGIREAGANGMVVDALGRLIIADSGTRAIAAIDLKTKRKTILADKSEGKRFNSCNDVALHSNGTIYFTDPPYGLAEGDKSPLKEIDFNGVYRLDPQGKVNLIDADLSRPNGVAVSADQQILYVAMSDEKRPQVLAYPLDVEGGVSDYPKVFCDFSAELDQKLPGLPDGIKASRGGHVFATGPGGVYILAADGRKLGLISTGKAIANCCFGEDGKTLFLTSSDMIARVRLKISGW